MVCQESFGPLAPIMAIRDLDDAIQLANSSNFGLAAGIAFDAFLVRMLMVPALMHLLGRHAWYIPKWLDRILPDVDVEGAKLTEMDPAVDDRSVEKSSSDAPVTTTSRTV